jgi:hypothetical protein
LTRFGTMNVARIPITADDPPNAPSTDALTPANVIHEQEVYIWRRAR